MNKFGTETEEKQKEMLESYRRITLGSFMKTEQLRRSMKRNIEGKSWEEIKEFLVKKYPNKTDYYGAIKKLCKKVHKDVMAFTTTFEDLVYLLEDYQPQDYDEKELCRRYVNALSEEVYEKTIENLNPSGDQTFRLKDLKKLKETALHVYGMKLAVKKKTITETASSSDDDSSDESDSSTASSIEFDKEKKPKPSPNDPSLRNEIQLLSSNLEKLTLHLTKVEKTGTPAIKKNVCFYCDREDCKKSQCPFLKTDLEKKWVSKDAKGFLLFADGSNIPPNYGKGGAKELVKEFRSRNGVRRVTMNSVGMNASHAYNLTYLPQDFDSMSRDELERKLDQMVDRGDVETANLIWKNYKIYSVKRKAEESNPPPKKSWRPWSSEDATEEAKDVEMKNPEPELQKRPTKLVSKLGSVEASVDEVILQMMETKVDTKVSDLLAVSPALRKGFEEMVKLRKVPVQGPLKVRHANFGPEDKSVPCLHPIVEAAPTVKIRGKVQGIMVDMEVDDGSFVTVVTMNLVQRVGGTLEPLEGRSLGLAGPYRLEVLGRTHLDIKFGSIEISVPCQVVASADFDVLLGQNWLRALRVDTQRTETGCIYILHSRNGEYCEMVPSINASGLHSRRIQLDLGERVVANLSPAKDEPEVSPVIREKKPKKKKKKKVTPQSRPLEDGSIPYEWPGDDPVKKIGTIFTEEDLQVICIGDGNLCEAEIEMFRKLLKEYEDVFAYDETEIGRIKMEPVKIRLIEHTPWSLPNIPIPRSLRLDVAEYIKQKLERGIFEPCHGPYRNQWFVIVKPNGKFRLIHNLQPANKLTIREIGSPRDVDSLTEAVSGSTLYAILDGTGGYSQMPLDESSRDCTAIETEFGLLRSTVAIQGATNSVAQYQRQMSRMFSSLIPEFALPYLDDLIVMNGKASISEREIEGIRVDVLEFRELLERVFRIAREYQYTFSPQKMKLGVSSVEVLGYECHLYGRTLTDKHANNVRDWPEPRDADEVRSFVQFCNFFRALIPNFGEVTASLYDLLKTGVPFVWGCEERRSFDLLKDSLIQKPILHPPNFKKQFIINCDAGPRAGGGYLGQELDDGTRVVVKYVSFKFSDRQRKYSQVKRELLVIMEMIKSLRDYIYGSEFIVETDCLPAIQMIKKLDLIDPTLTRWVTFISLFAPILVHIPGKKMVLSDMMSRLEYSELFGEEIVAEEEFDLMLRSMHDLESEEEEFQFEKYSEEFQQIGKFLISGVIPMSVNRGVFMRKALKFVIRDGVLYKKPKSKTGMPRKVICDDSEQQNIIKRCHDEVGHKGVGATTVMVKYRYFWRNMDQDIRNYIATCDQCQRFSVGKYQEELHNLMIPTILRVWHVDLQFMPKAKGYIGILEARESLSGWVEAVKVKSKHARVWTDFVFKSIFCRYGCVGKIITDNGELNSEIGELLFKEYGVKLAFTSSYNPQGNSIVERGHVPIADSLKRCSEGKPKRWVKYFDAAIWADRVTVRRSGYSAFYLMFGKECVFPVELEFGSWWLDYDGVQLSTEQLLAIRTKQLARLDDDREEAHLKLKEMRRKDKIRFDSNRNVRPESIKKGDLVLIHNSQLVKGKLDPQWFGPYLVCEVYTNGTYLLSELDGSLLAKPIIGHRLKKYLSREEKSSVGEQYTLGVNVVRYSTFLSFDVMGPCSRMFHSDVIEDIRRVKTF
jgi:hypothetical protein